MAVQVKICGITTAKDYLTCCDAGARWIGMVYYPGSPRHLDIGGLAQIACVADTVSAPAPLRVLLSVNLLGDDIVPLIEAARPDMLQLHGAETPADVAAIKRRFGLPIIKAVAVETADDLKDCHHWEGLADCLLFDAKVTAGAMPGGTGHSFDWSLLAGYRGSLDWMLAGGLTSQTLATAVKTSGAQALDVSSGVESAPGVKDPNQICAFIRAAQLI